jgi:hypothetical protein
MEHWLWAAADQCSGAIGSQLLFQQLGDKAVKTDAAIITGQMYFGARCPKIVHASGQILGAYTVKKRHLLALPARRSPAITPRSKQILNLCQKRRLADAAGDQADVIQIRAIAKTIPERAPRL